ncbi:MAG: hypothetical protein ABSE00_01795 [Chitinispirillaceae bacterium]|jgi:hypothetical protein
MKNRSITIFAIVFLRANFFALWAIAAVALCGTVMEADAAGKNTLVLSKDYIDTTIMQAIFLLSEGASVDGAGFARAKAIADAKMVAERLRAEARGDRNASYVIWKVNELEGQIALEEEDMVLQKVRQGQATIEALINDFNREVVKDRPDFPALQQFQTRMKGLDPQRAGAMGKSINSRGKTISRIVVVALEEALIYGNEEKADEEFRYCLRNQQFFEISPATFRHLEERVSVCDQSVEELKAINAEADSAQSLITLAGIGRARSLIADADYRLSAIKGQILLAGDSACAWRLIQLTSALKHCEDSLVQVNLDILRSKGTEAASAYLDEVVHPAGISREKSARIDQAILSVKSPAEKSNAMSREVDSVAAASEADGSHDVFEEIRQKAIKKARERQDSIRAIEEVRQRLELARLDSLEAEAKKKAELEFQANRTHAMQISSGIYNMIKTGKARVAYDMFDSKKPLLRQYLIPEAFALLEATVGQLLDPTWVTASNNIQLVANGAQAAPGAATPASLAERNREKATAAIETIYEMLGRNDIHGAMQQFDDKKAFLQAYLDKDAFTMLSEAVGKARQTVR